MVLGIPANLLILFIAHYMKNNNSFYSWFMYNITICDLVILIYTTVKLMYIRFGEDFTGWLPNDWFGSLICKGMISNWVQGRNGVRNAMARYLRLAGHVKNFCVRGVYSNSKTLEDKFINYTDYG